jgi:hypothetical protein
MSDCEFVPGKFKPDVCNSCFEPKSAHTKFKSDSGTGNSAERKVSVSTLKKKACFLYGSTYQIISCTYFVVLKHNNLMLTNVKLVFKIKAITTLLKKSKKLLLNQLKRKLVENSHLLNSSLYLVHYAFVQSQSIPFQV